MRTAKLILKSPLQGLRFHDLRHHAITELAESQASERTIMAIAGHISPRMLDHYSHIRMDAKRKALEALGGRASTRGYGTKKVVQIQTRRHCQPRKLLWNEWRGRRDSNSRPLP